MGLLSALLKIVVDAGTNEHSKAPYRNDGRMDRRTSAYRDAKGRADYARGCKDVRNKK